MPRGAFGTVCSNVNIFQSDEPVPTASDPFPKPNDDFYGFEIVEELGRGAFGRVFLAKERQLANRPVVLKVTLKDNNEQLRLARLQHTNIVPIQNAFRRGPFHVLQMPYFGRKTLADVIHHVREETGFPNVSGHVFTTVAKASTHRNTKHDSAKQDSGVTPLEPTVRPGSQPGVSPDVDVADVNPLQETLTGMPYAEAVLAIMRRLADGLAHAHNRSILHLDLKPQNVLFSDDGQPMLLDFNLSADRTTNDRKRVGGTWPYMAPEVIREYAKLSDETADERTDLYALGVMFFELLTCRLPFSPIRNVPEDLPDAIAEREQGALSVRDFVPEIPSAIDAIVQKLLAPNPADRYQTVDQLREDLQCQQEFRPLRYAADRSVVERLVKWHRRNPRAVAQIAVVTAAMVLTFGCYGLWNGIRERAKVEATVQAQEFQTAWATNQLDLAVPSDVVTRRAGMKSTVEWLSKYRVGDQDGWTSHTEIRILDEAVRTTLLQQIGEATLLLAHAEMLESRGLESADRAETLTRAARWNRLAEQSFGTATAPTILWEQRQELFDLTKDESLRTGVPEPSSTDSNRDTTSDRYVRAVRLVGDGKIQDAVGQLTTLTQDRPDHYAAQCLLALCYQASGQPLRALERFQVAQPLAKNARLAGHNRAIVLLNLGKYDQAEAEVSKTLKVAPGDVRLTMLRALILRRLNKLPQAIDDYTAVINGGTATITAYALRADCYRLLDKAVLAKQDLAVAEKLEAKTAEDFASRGWSLKDSNPSRALEEYNRAIKLDPNYVVAWQNKVCLLGDQLDELDLAVEVSQKLTTMAPSYTPGLATHSVLLARAGRRAEAHQAIQKALAINSDPKIVYQAACVYALTSAEQDQDRTTALNYFRQALREGYRNFGVIEADKDMKAALKGADFQAVLTAAKQLGN